jgi:RecA/RadA recombinase
MDKATDNLIAAWPPPACARTPSSRVYWITGLPGSGKTTVAHALQNLLAERGEPALLLDGDAVRAAFDGRFGHDEASRRCLAQAYGKLACEFAGQGLTVVCATVSMFHQVRDWNRAHIAHYWEVYIDAPAALRQARRSFYTDGTPPSHRIDEHSAELPLHPDQLLTNDLSETPQALAEFILSRADAAADRRKPA